MKKFSQIFVILLSFSFTKLLHGQFDSSLLSKLSPQQRQQLMAKFEGGNTKNSQDRPSAAPQNRQSEAKIPQENAPDTPEYLSDFLSELSKMESIISTELNNLLELENNESATLNKELEKEISVNKSLLRKIKEMQRKEIERRMEDFEQSQVEEVKPFGYDLFSPDPDYFEPGYDVPVPADYRIGPGDVLEIQLFGQRNDSFSLNITNDGMIHFPEIGSIHAFEMGTSFIALKNHILQKIGEHLGDGVQASISLGAFRTIRVFLLGEVQNQGMYPVSALSTAINALFTSGGVKESASLRNIQLKRGAKVISNIDLYDLLLHGDTSADHALQPGDSIFVPVVSKTISLKGEVRRPAIFEIKDEKTLEQILALGGGPTDRSDLDVIRLERLDDRFFTIVKTLKYPTDKDFKIKPGDTIILNSASSQARNIVSIIGSAEKEGTYEWHDGLLLSDLVNRLEDFGKNIDLNYGLIRRKNTEGSLHCLSFSPRELITNGFSKPILLHKEDEVFFFDRDSREEILEPLLADLRIQSKAGEFSKIVRISGEVHFPGEYPYTDSMSLLDLIHAGGGTKDSAHLIDAEISRVDLDNKGVAFLDHIKISQSVLSDLNQSNGFLLKPYDSLSIKPIPLWVEGEFVEVLGAVNFPGKYSIKRGETLYDVLIRAGGLTNLAFPEGAIFSRDHLRIKEDQQRERLIAQLEADLARSTLAAKDAQDAAQAESAADAILSRLSKQESQGRLVIDLEQVLEKGVSLFVKNGDRIKIPEIPSSVSVAGEVQFPTSHLYDSKLDINDYLSRSGGYTQNADKGRTFVVKANGSVFTKGSNGWFGKGNNMSEISPGDTIVVPIDVKQNRFLENLSLSSQVIYQMAVAAAAVNSF